MERSPRPASPGTGQEHDYPNSHAKPANASNSETASLMAMPPEILLTMASKLDAEAVRQTRLVCKQLKPCTFTAFGSQFRNITALPTTHAFEKLSRVCEHESLRPFIRSLTLVADTYRFSLFDDQYFHGPRRHVVAEFDIPYPSPTTRWQRCENESVGFLVSGGFEKALRGILGKVSVESVSILEICRSASPGGVIWRRNQLLLESGKDPVVKLGKHAVLVPLWRWTGQTPNTFATNVILNCIADSGSQVRSLRFDAIQLGRTPLLGNPSESFARVLSTLNTLTIRGIKQTTAGDDGGFFEFVSALPNLKHVHANIPESMRSATRPINMGIFLRKVHPRCLETFSMQRVCRQEPHLMPFLLRSKATLKRLTATISIVDDDDRSFWRRTLSRIGTELSLESMVVVINGRTMSTRSADDTKAMLEKLSLYVAFALVNNGS